MVSESAKRKTPAKRSERARRVPDTHRAPGRGKYDRTTSPDERQKAQLRRLLDAAGHVFAEMGWADATVEAIVNRAGMSRRTFYEHFADLRECLLVLHQKMTKIAVRAIDGQVQAPATPPDMLRMGAEAFLGGIAAFPHIARVMFRVVRSAGPEFEKIHEQMMVRFAKLVLDGVERSFESGQGTIRRPADGKVELRVFALVSGMEAIGMRYVMRGEEAKAIEAVPVLVDMVQKIFAS